MHGFFFFWIYLLFAWLSLTHIFIMANIMSLAKYTLTYVKPGFVHYRDKLSSFKTFISVCKRPTYVIISASLLPLDCSLSMIRGVSILLFYPQVLTTWNPEHCRHSMNIYQMMTECGGGKKTNEAAGHEFSEGVGRDEFANAPL